MPLNYVPRPLVLLLAVFVALGIVYDAVTPIFEAGDEQFHYPYVRHIASGKGLPLQDPAEAQAWRQEGSQPPLYYMLAAALTIWVDTSDAEDRLRVNPHAIIGIPAHGSNDNRNMMVHTSAEAFPYARTTLAVHLIRWLSLALATAAICATFWLARLIGAGNSTALLASAFVAFNPMFGFLAAAVNNDSLVILLAALCLCQMTRLWQDGLTRSGLVVLGVLLGLAALSKLSALGLAPLAGALITARIWLDARSGRAASPLRQWLVAALLTSAPFLAIAGWWYIRNWQLYGDPTGLNRMLAIVGVRQGTPAMFPLLLAEAEGMRLSFWGLFGGVNILAVPWQYVLDDLLTLLALAGCVWLFGRRVFLHRFRAAPAGALLWLSLWLLVLFLSWSRWTLITPATQGRLIFPALPVIALALALGINALPSAFTALVRVQTRAAPVAGSPALTSSPILAYGITAFLALLSLRTALFDIGPSYIPAPLQNAGGGGAALLRFGDALELLTVEAPATAARAGDTVEIVLTWRAVAPMPRDYSIFVHLLDEGDLIVGQRDTYPGLGLRSTTQLNPGDVVRDVYRVRIDDSAIAPSRPQIRVGVYDFAAGARLSSALGDNPSVGALDLLPRADTGSPVPVQYRFEEYFALTGYRIDRVAVRAGEPFTLTLLWRADRVPKDYSTFVHVLGKQDALWGQEDRQQPMRSWRSGELLEDRYVIAVKPDTPAGVYDLEIGAYDLADNFKRLNIWTADGQFLGDRILLRKLRVVR